MTAKTQLDDLRNSSPETISASFLMRVTAYLIDYVVMLCFGGLLFALSRVMPATWFATPNRAQLTSFLSLTLPVIVYFAFFEANGGTLGKRLRRITVVDSKSDGAKFGRTMLRNGVKFLPWEIAHTAVQHREVWSSTVASGIGIFAIVLMVFAIGLYFFTERKQTLWDLVAATRVVASA